MRFRAKVAGEPVEILPIKGLYSDVVWCKSSKFGVFQASIADCSDWEMIPVEVNHGQTW